MSARWITLQQAYQRAIEIEGVPELAFQKLCASLEAGRIEGRALPRETTYASACKGTSVFALNFEFWQTVVQLSFFHDVLEIEEHPDNQLMVGREFFSLSKWKIALANADCETSLSGDDAPLRAQTDLTTSPRSVDRRNAGGAPQKYDWAGAAGFLVTLLMNEDPKEGDAVKALEDWFAKAGREPAEGEPRKFVKKVFVSLKGKP